MGIIIKALEKIKSFFSRDAILSKALVQGRQISVGSDTQIIFNSGGILSASSNFVWNSGLGINTSSIVGVLNVSGNTSETLPIVNLITSSANNWMRGIRMLAANMGSGNSILYCLGKADSSRNMGQFYYYHSGDGSTSNRVSIGLHSVDDVLNVKGGGIVGIGTTNPSGKLHIYSTDTGSAGKLIVHSASGSYGQLQIASTNSEASIGFNASASAVGSSPSSNDGNSHLWGIGPGVFGMDGCEFGICNTEYGAPIITVRSSGRVAIGAGTTVGDINTRFKVIENAAQGVVSITNLHASGYSCIEFQNSGKTNAGGVGYGNSSVGLSALQGKMYLYAESGIDTVINCNGTTLATFKSDGKIGLGTPSPAGSCDIRTGSSLGALIGNWGSVTPEDLANRTLLLGPRPSSANYVNFGLQLDSSNKYCQTLNSSGILNSMYNDGSWNDNVFTMLKTGSVIVGGISAISGCLFSVIGGIGCKVSASYPSAYLHSGSASQTGAFLQFANAAEDRWLSIGTAVPSIAGTGDDIIFASYNGASWGERGRMTNAGLWGFGKTPAAEKVEVNGAIVIGARAGTADGTISYASNVFTFRQNGADVTLPTSSAKTVVIKAMADDTNLTTGDGKVDWTVPVDFNGLNLVDIDICVYTASTSGLPTVMLYNLTDTVDMLSVGVTIDENELTSYTATTPPTIDTSHDDVATGDILRIDVDVAGTGTKGLEIHLKFQ